MRLSLLVLLASSQAFAQAPVVAVVYGKQLLARDLGEPEARCAALQERVWTAVFADYVKRRGLEPGKKEIETCAKASDAKLRRAWDPKDGPMPAGLDLKGTAERLREWRRDVALYREHGGRMIFQQHGLEPIDAWRKLLESAEAKGDFTVTDPKLRACVYEYFSLKFFDAGEAATAKFLSAPQCLW